VNIYLKPARRHSRRRRRRGHDVLIMLLVLLLGALAMIAAVVWMAEHLAVLAGCVLLIAGAYYRGQQRRARPGRVQPKQARPEEPAAAVALVVATPLLADDWDEPGAEQRPAGQAGRDRPPRDFLTENDETITPASGRQPGMLPAGSDRDLLIATPMSGARPLWGPS
jgi:hypothetical protein